ncbi:DUF2218 domain-containing protein [Tropicimonas sediminicola]|uniref:2,4-dihydroxyhept-2-ene-1,7-dioic acid aldolase n=1 Tax=Tropicimonas sediminicola TaxID=1031541 RepID=A0A239LN72_9RHOB|nr:DUF2218 domain-containing protein [Tropicimonas sediminicola]SNT31119.1 hypothetical protein SAMN05421757_11085 [Tropicimonas sediminicola]
MIATTTFSTTNASRYLGTLCKHFGHKVPVEFDALQGRIDLPFGQCRLKAGDTALDLTVTAEDRPALDRLTEVIGSHLERFAFRENPQLDWQIPAA